MSWGSGSNGGGSTWPPDLPPSDRLAQIRARLAQEAVRLRDRAGQFLGDRSGLGQSGAGQFLGDRADPWQSAGPGPARPGDRTDPRLSPRPGPARPGEVPRADGPPPGTSAASSPRDPPPAHEAPSGDGRAVGVAGWRRGSLRGRLLWSFVGVAALAALIVGIVTLSLLRLASVNGLERQLQDQAEVASGIGGGPPPCITLASLRAVQTELYLVSADGTPQAVTCRPLRGRLNAPVAPPPDVDLRSELDGGTVKTGSRGSVVYAVAPLQQPLQDAQGQRYDGVLLTHSAGGLGIGLVGGVAWRLLLGTGLAMGIAAVVGWLLAGRLTAPLRRLAGAARQLGAGQLATRVQVEGDDEVAEVGTAFNEMAADLEQSQGEQRAFLASVSHELKTPLTAVQGYSEALLDGTVSDPPARQRTLERIHEETLRLARLVQDLIDLARLGRGQFAVSPVDADASTVLREAVAVSAERARAQGVSVEQRVPEQPLPAHFDPGRLRQVLDNLLDNAIRSSPAGSPVLVAARPLNGGWVEVAVVDRGPGIAAEDLPRAFDRGYLWSRYRGTRTVGSGLGLAIVKALCDAMGVAVRAESGREYGRDGTAFRLALPPARSAPASWAASGHGLPTPR